MEQPLRRVYSKVALARATLLRRHIAAGINAGEILFKDIHVSNFANSVAYGHFKTGALLLETKFVDLLLPTKFRFAYARRGGPRPPLSRPLLSRASTFSAEK